MEKYFPDGITLNSEVDKEATQIAASIIQHLPALVRTVAQYCLLSHWFDQDIIHALLVQLNNADPSTSKEIFAHLLALPFIDDLSSDAAYNTATRTGLLQLYASTQPHLLTNAAKAMAPLYAARGSYGPAAGEAFFCSTVANDTSVAHNLLDKLLDDAVCREDWYYITGLLQLYDEATQLPFVQAFPLSERQWLLRGLAHRAQGDLGQAIHDYLQAIDCNSSNILTYIALGAAYVEQQHYSEALKAYEAALEIDSTYAQANINKGIVYMRAANEAKKADLTQELQLSPTDIKEALLKKALACFEAALHLSPDNSDAQHYYQQVQEILPQQKKTGSLPSVSTVHIPSSQWILLLYPSWLMRRLLRFSLLVVFWSISYNIVANERENFFVQVWQLVLRIGSYVTTTASSSPLLPIALSVAALVLSLLLGERIITAVNVHKKSANERELFLWAASQPALDHQINKQQIALIRETRFQHIKKGVIRLAY
jgi:tetratricopeptide (TPR) repeat protein